MLCILVFLVDIFVMFVTDFVVVLVAEMKL